MKFENDPMNSLLDTAWTKLRTGRQTDMLIPISLRYMGDNKKHVIQPNRSKLLPYRHFEIVEIVRIGPTINSF